MRDVLSFVISVVAVSATLLSSSAYAAESDSKSVTVSAVVGSRTSLKVSSDVLEFHVTAPDRDAVVFVDFHAGARTYSAGEVVLSVESVCTTGELGGRLSLSFAGSGEGTLNGTLAHSAPTTAAKWIGSGARTGRLAFALRAPAPGVYVVPVRFLLSVP